MKIPDPIYELRGSYKQLPFELIARDVKYLQHYLAEIRRDCGDGFIWRL